MASALMKCSPAAKSAAGIIRSAAAAAVRTYLPVAGSDVVAAAARGSLLKCRSLNEGFCSNFPAAPVIQMIKEKELGTLCTPVNVIGPHSLSFQNYNSRSGAVAAISDHRCMTTAANPVESMSQESSAPMADVAPRIKFKRLDKTAKHIMQILDKEAVEEVKSQREIPDVKPGYIIQLKVEVPENKRRITTIKGIVIARRNAGLNTTFRLRRLVAGIGVESLFPLYSPNIKEIKVLEKKKVRRAKLYYLRERMNALRK